MLAVPAAFTVPTEVPPADALGSIVVLGLVCTALAFVVFSVLIREVGPGKALVITYVNPVVAVALGVDHPRRAARRGRRRRPAADPRRLVALDRRPAPAGARPRVAPCEPAAGRGAEHLEAAA